MIHWQRSSEIRWDGESSRTGATYVISETHGRYNVNVWQLVGRKVKTQDLGWGTSVEAAKEYAERFDAEQAGVPYTPPRQPKQTRTRTRTRSEPPPPPPYTPPPYTPPPYTPPPPSRREEQPDPLPWRQSASGRIDAFGRYGSYHIMPKGNGWEVRWLYRGSGKYFGTYASLQTAKREAEIHNMTTTVESAAENPLSSGVLWLWFALAAAATGGLVYYAGKKSAPASLMG